MMGFLYNDFAILSQLWRKLYIVYYYNFVYLLFYNKNFEICEIFIKQDSVIYIFILRVPIPMQFFESVRKYNKARVVVSSCIRHHIIYVYSLHHSLLYIILYTRSLKY